MVPARLGVPGLLRDLNVGVDPCAFRLDHPDIVPVVGSEVELAIELLDPWPAGLPVEGEVVRGQSVAAGLVLEDDLADEVVPEGADEAAGLDVVAAEVPEDGEVDGGHGAHGEQLVERAWRGREG